MRKRKMKRGMFDKMASAGMGSYDKMSEYGRKTVKTKKK